MRIEFLRVDRCTHLPSSITATQQGSTKDQLIVPFSNSLSSNPFLRHILVSVNHGPALHCLQTDATNKGGNQRSKDVTQTQQRRPESPTVLSPGMPVNTRYMNFTRGTVSTPVNPYGRGASYIQTDKNECRLSAARMLNGSN